MSDNDDDSVLRVIAVKGDNVVCGLNNASAVVFSSSTKNSLSCSSAFAGDLIADALIRMLTYCNVDL